MGCVASRRVKLAPGHVLRDPGPPPHTPIAGAGLALSLILQRALEPQAGSAELDPNELGLSLDKLKEIAAEVGINPQRIDLAASSLMEPSPASVNPYAGIPPTVQYQAMVAGKDLADIPTHEVSAVIRRTRRWLSSTPGWSHC